MNPPVPSQSTPSWEWNGNAFVPRGDIPLTDRGFRYGMSLFESIRVSNGTPLFLSAHLTRLERAGTASGIQPSQSAMASVDSLLRTSGIDGFARIYVTAGDGGLTDPVSPRVFVFIEQRSPLAAEAYRRGYEISSTLQRLLPQFPGMKTGNYWSHVRAFAAARESGSDEALLLNEKNLVVSTSMANLFIVRGGKIQAPALSCGARDGVVREWVMSQLPVEQSIFGLGDVENAEEMFLTNSWIGVMPVRKFGQREFPSREYGQQLHASYESAIADAAR